MIWGGRREEGKRSGMLEKGEGETEWLGGGEGRRGKGVVWEGRRVDGRMSEIGREKGREGRRSGILRREKGGEKEWFGEG